MDFHQKRTLGRTGLRAGRLGISSSFGAPAAAYEEAFERGCNYFTWGTFIRGRSKPMADAVRNIVAQGKRDQLILSMLTYAHQSTLTTFFLERGLKTLKTDYTDVLLLGYFPKRPPQKVIDGALQLKERGLVRHLGITSHNRRLFVELAREDIFDVFHFRYSPAHPGAEVDIFPHLPEENRSGMVSFTATDWGNLLKKGKMPAGEKPLTAAECYGFVLANPGVDVCMMGAKNRQQMQENLALLDRGSLEEEEIERIRRIGRYVHG
ncbi:MAG: aldo/keto reductase [Proteobacteria bacterium]|nr:aldo/keto reductase [Pseudomonadota bacterium]MBU1709624.1 aldo/keto reductase [Pseudomonadota bacterium]